MKGKVKRERADAVLAKAIELQMPSEPSEAVGYLRNLILALAMDLSAASCEAEIALDRMRRLGIQLHAISRIMERKGLR